MDENAVKIIAEDVMKDKMEDFCKLRHEVIVEQIGNCIGKKINGIYKFFIGSFVGSFIVHILIRKYL